MTAMNMTISNASNTSALALRDPWAMVPSLGSLDAYISAANRVPMLTLEEEQSLARQLRDKGDLQAAGQLVLSHMRLVVSRTGGIVFYNFAMLSVKCPLVLLDAGKRSAMTGNS